jgi:hypothetical protein
MPSNDEEIYDPKEMCDLLLEIGQSQMATLKNQTEILEVLIGEVQKLKGGVVELRPVKLTLIGGDRAG